MDFAFLQFEFYIVQSPNAGKRLADVLHLQDWLNCGHVGSSSTAEGPGSRMPVPGPSILNGYSWCLQQVLYALRGLFIMIFVMVNEIA
jgi:hypothetical protein